MAKVRQGCAAGAERRGRARRRVGLLTTDLSEKGIALFDLGGQEIKIAACQGIGYDPSQYGHMLAFVTTDA
jgi:N-acetylglutamate synthase/N-acetylornithine aminotransferase